MTSPSVARECRLRVLHVLQNMNYGGMERVVADLVQRGDARHIDSHILVLQYRGRFAEGLERVATLHEAPMMSRLSMLRPLALERKIREIAPHVVHTHSGVWYKASLAARRAGVPGVVHTEHGRWHPDPWLARYLDGVASRRTNVVVGVSDSVANILHDRIVRGGCHVQCIRNGVDTERFQPTSRAAALRNRLGIAHDATILGSIGRLERIKGYDILLDAFALLVHQSEVLDRSVLVIAGDGAERDALRRRVAERNLTGRVFLLGWRDDVEELLGLFDCFVMSSRSEGTSVSLLEAMSAGLCPVVTDVGGNREVLGQSLMHRLVPSEQPTALAKALRDAVVDSSRRRADAQAARQRVVSEFNVSAMVSSYEQLYRSTAWS